jgi:hypothetical protein
MNSSIASGGMRIGPLVRPPTRKCRSFPRAQRFLTLLLLHARTSAAIETVSARGVGGGRRASGVIAQGGAF